MAMPFIDLGNLRISTQINNTNDTVAGGNVAGGTGQQLYAGLLGKRIWLDNLEASRLSLSTTGTLFAGTYQYVQFLSTMTATPALGQMCFWKPSSFTATDGTQYVVTCDGSATVGDGMWAGVVLNAVTKGNFAWIQVDGLATVRCKAVVTDSNIGDLAVVTTTLNTVDGIADATAVTAGGTAGAKSIVGTWVEAPTNGTLKKVFMRSPVYF